MTPRRLPLSSLRWNNRATTSDAAPRPILVPLVVACAMFMQNLDSTVIATALPTIARSLDESPLTLNVAITCYLLSLAVFIPISGWTADRFGARRVFSAAIVVFTLGSIGCGMANSLAALVAARIVQGMGGALMVPVGRLVLLRTVEKSDLVRAMSYVSVPALIGPVMGPPLGGFIVTYCVVALDLLYQHPDRHLGHRARQSAHRRSQGRRPPAVRLWRFCADRRRARDPGLRLRECRARRVAEHSRRGAAGCRRRLHGALCAPRSARRPSDHRLGAVSESRPTPPRRSAVSCSAWGWARCRFCCR